MKFKDYIEKSSLKSTEIKARAVHDNMIEMSLDLNNGSMLNTYLFPLDRKGNTVWIMVIKILDSSEFVELVFKHQEVRDEIEKKWPQFAEMLHAGERDIYSDAALIIVDDQVLIATGFDMGRWDAVDATDYRVEKMLYLLKRALELADEMNKNELNFKSAKLKRIVGAVKDGYRDYKRGKMAANVLRFLLGW